MLRDFASAESDLSKLSDSKDAGVESLRAALAKAISAGEQRLGARLKDAFNKQN